jgi:hypothetical protein
MRPEADAFNRIAATEATLPSHTWRWPVFFLILCYEAIGTAATPGLLCQPRVIVKMIVEKHMECRCVGETEVLGENLPQCHFCPSQNPTWPDPGLNPGRRGGKPAINLLRRWPVRPKHVVRYNEENAFQ